MVRLGRLVRFSINPFLEEDGPGCNSYASKPAGEGVTIYLELAAELVGPVQPETGLLVNDSDIDRIVRRFAVPVFAERIREHLRQGKHIPLAAVSEILWSAYEHLTGKFNPTRMETGASSSDGPDAVRVDRLTLKLNPFRKLSMDTKDRDTMYFSEKFEFAAGTPAPSFVRHQGGNVITATRVP
jgi:hypothetical protein